MSQISKKVFGYIRVSTVKQGQKGVSLQEQRDAIIHYAKINLEIVAWFEETETAAKQGRPVFNRMLKLLRQVKAAGVILHKIDRGARNLKDWSDIADLIDAGIEVHFANESLDMQSRGGRLSADIQAVVAADYIRNLREETKKGFYGRLKQGLYPLAAPLGYRDMGKGKSKEPDPLSSLLVRKAFESYATGRYSLDTLLPELHMLGLRNKNGGKVSLNGLSRILNNPFYIGVIRLKQVGETFPGIHPPLISKSLFGRVQAILRSKSNTRVQTHDFLFRRLFSCGLCGGTLIGEHQKQHRYYRCHTKGCPLGSAREEKLDAAMRQALRPLQFNQAEQAYFRERLAAMNLEWMQRQEEELTAVKLRFAQNKGRMNRLTDALLDKLLDKPAFEERKAALLMEQKGFEETMANIRAQNQARPGRVEEFLELARTAWLSYEMGNYDEKRDLTKITTSNREVTPENVVIKLSFPFFEVANRSDVTVGDPYRDRPRTFERLLQILAAACTRGRLPVLDGSLGCGEDCHRSDGPGGVNSSEPDVAA